MVHKRGVGQRIYDPMQRLVQLRLTVCTRSRLLHPTRTSIAFISEERLSRSALFRYTSASPLLPSPPRPPPRFTTEFDPLTRTMASTSSIVVPPVAPEKPKVAKSPFGEDRVDPYAWLRDRKDPDTIPYLEKENEYADFVMKGTKQLQEKVYQEFLSKIKETDDSVPYKKGKYSYYTRTVEGLQYKIYCRKEWSVEDAEEEILLDGNKEAEGHEYCDIADVEPSPSGDLLAFLIDSKGDEKYLMRIKNLKTGELLEDKVEEVCEGVEWANEEVIFFVRMDHAQRPYQLFRHKLGRKEEDDEMLHEETDERFFLSIGKTHNQQYIEMSLDSQITSEVHILPVNDATGKFKVFLPRQHEVEYSIEIHENTWFLLTNADGCKNFKLLACPTTEDNLQDTSKWTELIPHRRNVKLNYVLPFKDHIVISQRHDGLSKLEIMNPQDKSSKFISLSEPAYSLSTTNNHEFDTEWLRYTYSSFITPNSTFDYNMRSGERKLLKEKPVLGGYDRTKYVTERLFATADDGTKVPISLVRLKTTPTDGTAPALLYGYGSYGLCYDASFRETTFSFVDRGMVVANAAIRGGGDLGRYWYEDGKLLKKKNTFTDFLACAKHLADAKYTSSDRLAVYGASAGGLLIGACLNMAGDKLFNVAIARVPFVDCINTLLDKDLPLTVIEWEEWGNPYEKEYWEYILSYAPYENVTAQRYPKLLVKGGLNDPRVAFWEPAKLTARLRKMKTDDNVLIMKTNMGAGHFGASGRYDLLKESAFEHAFVIRQLGLE